MKLSIFTQHSALNSTPVFDAFRKGAEKLGYTVVENDREADVYVIWSMLWSGRMSANQELYRYAITIGKPIIILEVGGLKRGETWRIGLNHVNRLGTFNNDNNLEIERSKKLGIFLKPWRQTGNHILICGQHTQSEQWRNRAIPELWIEDLVKKIKLVSTREIIVRPHPRDTKWVQRIKDKTIKIQLPKKLTNTYDSYNHDDDFKDAWCVINPTSNTGIQAAIAGIPVFCDKDSLAFDVGNYDISTIEQPAMPDRTEWLEKLCHTEWTVEEIGQGTPLSRIFNKRLDIR
jgi:hypothetical protein